MNWQRVNNDLIASGPFYILRCKGPNGARYLVGKGPECFGGRDTPEEAKQLAEVVSGQADVPD